MGVKFTTSPQKNEYLSGWRRRLAFAGVFCFSLLFVYPLILDPMINVDKYKRVQEETRKELEKHGIVQGEGPAELKKWSNPFYSKTK